MLLHTACMGSTDSVPPQVALTSPAAGSILSGTVQLQATASDDQGISKVEFYVGSGLVAVRQDFNGDSEHGCGGFL